MKQNKTSKPVEAYLKRNIDYYDYQDFDDDYYHDMIEERNNSLTKRHRFPRKNARHARAFNNFGTD
jgi:hypothetical protein|tara:strand:+ start:35532 stop:35729 length:198 start_codon:yes stop_codon:yes gene_type:complete